MSIRRTALVLACATALAGCRGRPGHPVCRSMTSAPSTRPAAARAPGPHVPDGAVARAALLQGFIDAENALQRLRGHAMPIGTQPRLYSLPNLERAAYRRTRGSRSMGYVRNAAAVGYCAHFAAPPRAVADLILDPKAETRALGADRFTLTALEFDVGGASRRRFRVEMLRRGQAPFLFNLRFTFLTERWNLPNGSVVLRHDLCATPRPEHVPIYRGVTLIEPEGAGSRVTEFLVSGSDISVPFFLRGVLRKKSIELFASRVRTLWKEAAALPR